MNESTVIENVHKEIVHWFITFPRRWVHQFN